MMMRSLAGLIFALATLFAAVPAYAVASDCLAMAQGPSPVQKASFTPTALEANQVRLSFLGHATFLIESPGGMKIATDYDGYAGDTMPDVVTMNHAHTSHYTDAPDPAIKQVLRGWNDDGSPAQHNLYGRRCAHPQCDDRYPRRLHRTGARWKFHFHLRGRGPVHRPFRAICITN